MTTLDEFLNQTPNERATAADELARSKYATLACDVCDVTWRIHAGEHCWVCGDPGNDRRTLHVPKSGLPS